MKRRLLAFSLVAGCGVSSLVSANDLQNFTVQSCAFFAQAIFHPISLLKTYRLNANGEVTAEYQESQASARAAATRRVFAVAPNTFSQTARKNFDMVLRTLLMNYNRRRLPATTIDVAPVADAIAKSLYKELPAEQMKNIDVPAAIQKASATVEAIRSYPQDKLKLASEQANLVLKRIEIQYLLAHPDKMVSNADHITVSVPNFDPATGKLTGTAQVFFYDSPNEMLDELKDLLGQEARMTKLAQKRADQQATDIKTIEIYQLQFDRAVANHPATADKDPAADELLKKIKALFDPARPGRVTDTLEPPKSAWANELKKQVNSEMWAVVRKPIPALKDEDLKKFLAYVTGLSDQDKKILGLGQISDTLNIWRRSQWGSIASLALGTVGIGGSISAPALLNAFTWTRQEDCAFKGSEADFTKCVDDYIAFRFTEKFLTAQKEPQKYLTDGQISDPEIKSEVARILARRAQVTHDTNVKGSYLKIVNDTLNNQAMTSPGFAQQLVESTDAKWFKQRMLSADPTVGYLTMKEPLAFSDPAAQALVAKAIDDMKNTTALNADLDALAKIPNSASLSQLVRKIILARASSSSDKKASALLEADLSKLLSGSLNPTPVGTGSTPAPASVPVATPAK